MGQISRMNQMIQYIESHLKEPINYGELTKIACLSKFHLHRLFILLADVGLGEYIRERRLTKAAQDLIANQQSITEIAFDYQYSSASAFSRAFSSFHGFPPSLVQDNEIKACPMISFQLEVKGAKAMNYKIIEKNGFDILGKEKSVSTKNQENFQEVPKFWQESHGNGLVEKLMKDASDLGILGVCMEMDDDEETFTYMIAIENTDDLKNPDLRKVSIPKSTWAVFQCNGPMPDAMQSVWKRIYSEWFPSTGYEHAGTPELEVYLPGDPSDENYVSEIWIPIKND